MTSHHGFVWTEQAVSDLRALRAAGFTGGQIARDLSTRYHAHFTRNSIIGKCLRMGIGTPNQKAHGSIVREQNKAPKSNGPPLKKVPLNFSITPPLLRPEPAPAARPAPTLTSPHAVSIFELKPHHCRWPLGEEYEKATLFCGAKRRDKDCSYCAKHAALAFNPRRPWYEKPSPPSV